MPWEWACVQWQGAGKRGSDAPLPNKLVFATSLRSVKLTKGCALHRLAMEDCLEKWEETRKRGIGNILLNDLLFSIISYFGPRMGF